MTSATKRTCRTCPMVVAEGADQCRPCQQRSAAVREAVRSVEAPERKIRSPRKWVCEQSGHIACEHHRAILTFLIEWADDMAMCPVCSAELPQDAPDDAPMPHKAGCMLALVIAPAPAGPGMGEGMDR